MADYFGGVAKKAGFCAECGKVSLIVLLFLAYEANTSRAWRQCTGYVH